MGYLVWSIEHNGWWKAGLHGYTTDLTEAAVMSRDKAIKICRDALPGTDHRTGPNEIPVSLADLNAMLAPVHLRPASS